MRTDMKEKDLQKFASDYLQFYQNMGRLFYIRQNSGKIFSFHYSKKNGKWKKYHIGLAQKGTADFIVFSSNGRVFFLELKKEKNKLSEEQKKNREMLEELGHKYYVAYTPEEVAKIIEENI